MKFTYSWLKEHLETEHQYNEVVDKLTAIGLEVESVQDTGLAYKDFIVGQVLEEEKHPNACLLYTSPSPRDVEESRMPSSA